MRRGKPTGAGPPKRANNAERHGMDGSVTRAIAYAAVQVWISCRLSTQLTLPVALQPYRRYPLDEQLQRV